MEQKRDRWPSRTLFIFAAVGSAVGLGNIWRFPYLVGKYGGGAFLLPYILMLFLVGFPLLILEFAIGKKMQQGAVAAFRTIHPKLAGVGLGTLFCCFAICCYYAVVMGWCILYTFYSFNLSWGEDTQGFFLNHVLHISSSPSTVTGFVPLVLLAAIAAWVLVYFCVWKGVKSVSNVVLITMPLPIILLFLLLGRTIFLPGALDGLKFFLTPDFSALWDLEVWMAAVTQVFFTLTLGIGVMITYASYQEKNSDIVKNALITAIADGGIALLAGCVVFTTIGYMSHTGDGTIEELAASGPSLAFVVLPEALATIPGAIFFSIIFFLTLVSLAIDSLFSLVEAILTLFTDAFPQTSKKRLAFLVCLVCFLGGLVFTTTAGIYYLDIVDHFVTHYGLVLAGLTQSLAIGWVYGADKLRSYINEVSEISVGKWWSFLIKYLIPFAMLTILIETVYRDLVTPYEEFPQWALFAFGWGFIGFVLIVCIAYSASQKKVPDG